MQPIIELKEIRKTYFMGATTLEVLKGISLNIFKNEYPIRSVIYMFIKLYNIYTFISLYKFYNVFIH